MVINNYLEKFIIKIIKKYIPKGIHPELHIDCQIKMFEIITKLIKDRKTPMKLSVITYLCSTYRDILYKKYSILN